MENKNGSAMRRVWSKYTSLNGSGVLIAMIVYIILISVVAPFVTGGTFLTYTNIMNVLRQQSYIGIIATAMTFVIMTGNIDLSVGSLLTLLAVICAQLTQYGPWVAIIVTLLLGLVCGAINGLFVAGMKLNAFITTIAMGSVYGALTLIIAPGSTTRVQEPVFDMLGGGFVLGFIPTAVFIMIVFVIV